MSEPTYIKRRRFKRVALELIRYDHRYPAPTKLPRRTVWKWSLILDRKS